MQLPATLYIVSYYYTLGLVPDDLRRLVNTLSYALDLLYLVRTKSISTTPDRLAIVPMI